MTLFSLFALLAAHGVSTNRRRAIVPERLAGLAPGPGGPAPDEPDSSAHSQALDLENWCRQHVGPEFVEYVKEHGDPLDIVLNMAHRGHVLLNGNGFDAPPWTARVSLANLSSDAYPQIGAALREAVDAAIERWKKAK